MRKTSQLSFLLVLLGVGSTTASATVARSDSTALRRQLQDGETETEPPTALSFLDLDTDSPAETGPSVAPSTEGTTLEGGEEPTEEEPTAAGEETSSEPPSILENEEGGDNEPQGETTSSEPTILDLDGNDDVSAPSGSPSAAPMEGGEEPTVGPSDATMEESSEPSSGETSFPTPSYGEPTYGEPTYGEPIYGEPTYGEPTYGDPMYGEPTQYGYPGGQPSFYAPPTDPTDEPTEEYIPPDDDPLMAEEEEEENDKANDPWSSSNNDYETIEEMEKDRNVLIALTVVFSFGFIMVIITAQQMLENPDGICASLCRICVACNCGITRCLCYPCRMMCGCTKDRRSHDLILQEHSNNYTHDLELS